VYHKFPIFLQPGVARAEVHVNKKNKLLLLHFFWIGRQQIIPP
jgi:hypothetical protein